MHGNRPEEAAGNPLESAAHDLRRSLPADGDDLARSQSEQRTAQARILRAWAHQEGLILDPELFLDPATRGGEEHLVWPNAAISRYIKLTHAGRFGLAADAQWFFDEEHEEAAAKAYLRAATPLEYLDRLILQNTVFGDDLRLLGIIDKARGLAVFDCHVGNFIKSGPHVVPIDLIVQRAVPALRAALGC